MKAILLNRILLVLAFIGIFVAGVLSLEKGLNLEVPCGPSGGCATVANDPRSLWLGIPVAYFGLVGYLVLAALAIARSVMPVRAWKQLVGIGYAASAVGTLVSLYLQYQAFFEIHATCLWCLSSAILMIVTLIVYAMLAQQMESLSDADVALDAAPDRPLFIALPIAAVAGITIAGFNMQPAMAKIPEVSEAELIPADAHIFGQPGAPLTVVEFADLCCPACQRTSPKVKEFVMEHPGQIRIVWRNYPLANLHKEALSAATIGEIAADEHRFWEYAMSVLGLDRQPNNIDELISIAKANGINEQKLRTRLQDKNDPAYGKVARDLALVKKLGITSTPTFLLVSKGKVLDVAGPSQIMDRLDDGRFKNIMSGHGS